MNSTDSGRIERAIDKAGRCVLYLLFLVLVVEGLSWLALKLNSAMTVSANQALTQPAVRRELAEVQSGSLLFPTRWYTNLPRYRGEHVVTDDSGFRIDVDAIKYPDSIAFFGGSTMFSVVTDQAGTIPNQVNISGFNTLNFGVGGYSTAAELPTLIEALRKYESVRVAVFYDGVNEIGRYVEMLQDGAPPYVFDKVGYYYRTGLETAISAGQRAHGFEWNVKTPSMAVLERVQLRLRVGDLVQGLELERVASEIADLYFVNLLDIDQIARVKGVTPVFLLQPNIFTTRKRLTDAEATIKELDKSLVSQLAPMVRDRIMSDPRSAQLGVVDMSEVLDEVVGDVFYDWCHLNSVGNGVVAKEIELVMEDVIRQASE